MVILSEQAKHWLKGSDCFEEISDDMLSLAGSGIQILLCKKVLKDLSFPRIKRKKFEGK